MWNAKVSIVPGPWPKVSVSLERDGRKAIEVLVDPAASTAAHQATIGGFLFLFASGVRKDFSRAVDQVRNGAGRTRVPSTVGEALEHVDQVKRDALRIVDEELARARLDIAARKAELRDVAGEVAKRRLEAALAMNPDVIERFAAEAAGAEKVAPATTTTTEKAPNDGGST